MEILVMIAIAAATLGLIWLIVREPEPIRRAMAEDFRPIPPMTKVMPTREEIFEVAQEARTPRAYVKPVEKPVDKPKPKSYSSSSSRSSSGGSSYSSRSDDSYSSYSSWGGGSSSSSSSSCDSSSSSSSSSSCD